MLHRQRRWGWVVFVLGAISGRSEAWAQGGLSDAWPDVITVTPAAFQQVVSRCAHLLATEPRASLTEAELEWLLEADGNLRQHQLEVPREADALTMVGESYQSRGAYAEATEYFLRANDPCRIESTLWLLANAESEQRNAYGPLGFEGAAPDCGPRVGHPVQTTEETFLAYTQGPVYRLDKRRAWHAVIFVTPEHGNPPIALSWKDARLTIVLKNGDRYRFDNRTATLEFLDHHAHPQHPATTANVHPHWQVRPFRPATEHSSSVGDAR